MVKTKNINVEVEEDLYFELRRLALEKRVEFHQYIRLVFQEYTGIKKQKGGKERRA